MAARSARNGSGHARGGEEPGGRQARHPPRDRRGSASGPQPSAKRGVNGLRFRAFKWSVYGLLALNTVLFLLIDPAWVVLNQAA